MPNTKKEKPIVAAPASPDSLLLTDEQKQAIELWETSEYEEEIAAAAGVTLEVLQDWQKQPLFGAALLNEEYGHEADMEELKAVALVMNKTSFADAEEALQLDSGTLTEWAKDSGSPFAMLLELMRDDAHEEDRTERLAKHEEEEKALKEQQVLAIPLILAGKTDAEVAESVGVARETINRWRNHDSDFMRELRQSREAQLESHMTRISNANDKAVNVLEDLLDSEDEQVRLRAAMHLLKTVSLTHKEPKY